MNIPRGAGAAIAGAGAPPTDDSETVPGSSTKKYPSSGELPKEPEKPEGTDNPVIGAIKVIQEFVLAKAQQNDPAAESMKQALVALLQAMSGQGEGQASTQRKRPVFNPYEAPKEEGEEEGVPPEAEEEGMAGPSLMRKRKPMNKTRTIEPLI